MKLFKRMVIFLGGGVAVALLIHAVIVFIGFSGHQKYIQSAVSSMQEEGLNQATQNAALGNSVYLEEKFNVRFHDLELLFAGKNPEEQIQKLFSEKNTQDIDYVVVVQNGKTFYRENPSRKSEKKLLDSAKMKEFLHQIKDEVGTKKYYIRAVPLYPGSLWVIYSDPAAGKLAVLRMDGDMLLKDLPSISQDTVAALVYGNEFAAFYNPEGSPPEIEQQMRGICRNAEHNHEKRLLSCQPQLPD